METESAEAKKENAPEFTPRPIETLGEAFADGCFIEAVHDPIDQAALKLMIVDGESAQIASSVHHEGRIYVPREVDPSIVRELHLPAEFRSNETAPQLFGDLIQLVHKYSGLPEIPSGLLARFVLAGWVMEALPAAPALVLIGPESRESTQLFDLLKCVCRHGLLLTEVTANGLTSLPTELGLTLLIDQPHLTRPLERMLNASRKRGARVPCRGGLWPSSFSKVVHCAEYFQAWPIKAAKISIIPTTRAIPLLDDREKARIVSEFQPRLLGYRFANIGKLPVFDNSMPDYAARRTVNALVASALDSAELQAEIVDLVADEVAESREERWTDPAVVLIEALLMYSHSPDESLPYVGEITDAMQTLFSARGEERKLKPNQVSKMIRHLGLKLEPRDSAGVKLRMTEAVRRKIHEFAYEFAVPSIENQVAGCSHCAAIAKRKESASTDRDSGTPRSI